MIDFVKDLIGLVSLLVLTLGVLPIILVMVGFS